MTHMVTRAKALPRRLIQGGAAGDAGSAGGRVIASNVAVQLLARAITLSISVVTVSLTARTLDPTGYGVWSGASNFTGLFAVLTDLGLTTVAMQRMADDPEREHEWLGALAGGRVALSLLATVVCAASVPLLLSGAHNAHAVALVLTLTIPMFSAGALMTVFSARLRAGLVLSVSVLQSSLWLIAVIALAITNASVVQFAVAYVLLAVVIAAVQLQLTRRHARIAWRAGARLWRPLMRVAFPLGLAGVMITIYYQVDSVLLLQISGARQAGIYGAAYGFLGPLLLLPGSVMASFFPVLSAVIKPDPARARRLVQICADSMMIISLPILAGAIALAGPIIRLLYGPGFQGAAGLLPILMIAFVSICFGTIAGFLAPLIDRQWRLALYASIGAVANVALNLALIPSYRAYGSAWATVATELLTMALMLGTALRTLKLRLSLGSTLRTLALAAAMTGVMVLARPLGLVPAGLIGVLFYAAGLFVLRIVDWRELQAIRAQPVN
ncbi:MAG TPA: flippase [Solirubrobacteraceae bacterium]|jgi:O-antigen/teichoic acid export membrane protein|nr:flippase [Solirubrobacteraceae bacterium]